MNKDGIYYELTQEYMNLKAKRRLLMQDRDKVNTQLVLIEDILIDLNNILCKYGNHIYEHFVDTDSQAESD